MRIIIEELKKIFNMKIITILIGFTALYYFMFIEFYITDFPNGHPETEMYNLGKELVERYGNVLDEDEFRTVKEDYVKLMKKADDFIKGSKVFQAHNIKNYRHFVEFNEKSNEGLAEVYFELSDEFIKNTGYLLYELETYERFMKRYEGGLDYLSRMKEKAAPKFYRHIEDISQDENIFYSILPGNVFTNFVILNRYLAVLLSISLMIIISPYLVRDYLNDIIPLQVSSRIGRKLLNKQLEAISLASFIVILVQLMIFLFAYSLNNTSMFFDSFINSFYNTGYFSWGKFTFIQYIIWAIIFSVIFGFGAGFISFFLSKICKNYIAVVAAQIPLVFVYSRISKKLFEYNIFQGSFMLLKPLLISALLIIGLISLAILIVRERKVEI